jgi:hypothetical protein
MPHGKCKDVLLYDVLWKGQLRKHRTNVLGGCATGGRCFQIYINILSTLSKAELGSGDCLKREEVSICLDIHCEYPINTYHDDVEADERNEDPDIAPALVKRDAEGSVELIAYCIRAVFASLAM